MKKLVIASALAAASCGPAPVSDNAIMANLEMTADNYDAIADAVAEEVAETPAEPKSGWAYDESKDEMRGATSRFARIDAEQPITLGFPYGSSTPRLTIRQDAKYGFDIFLTANGQFLCRSYNDDTVSIKFDDGPIREWSCAEADGGSSEIMFFNRERALLAEIRKSERMIVEARMYDAGRQQMTFNVAGLEWE